jgi:gliding motility-associated-like protein
MKFTSTPSMFLKCLGLIFGLVTITLLNSESYAQTKNYAQITPSTGATAYYSLLGIQNQQNTPNAGSVTNPGNASIVPPTAPATLSANYFTLLGLANAEGEAWIQMKYAAPVAAGKTTYIRFDGLTTTGINLDLLTLVGDLTGLFSKNLVALEAYTGAAAGTDGTKIQDNLVTSTIVKDAAGQTYFAVTSAAAYNSVRVKLRFRSTLLGLSLGSALNLNVYTPFNYTADDCGTSVFTNLGEAPGLNVSLTSLVSNAERAIDGNPATFSQLQVGLVGLGSSVSQTVYLNGLSSAGDVAKVVLSQPGTVLSVNLLRTITLQAFNGTTAVGGVQSAGNLLSLQLLSPNNNNPVGVFFTPGAPFDRIKITVDNTLAIGGNILSGGLNVHEVQRTVTKPIFAGTVNSALSICGGSTLALAAQTPNPAYTYNFYKKVNNVTTQVATATAGAYTEPSLTAGTYTYYITAQKAGCTGESDRDSVLVTVKPTLVFASTTLSNGSAGKVYSRQINPATGGTPTYTYALAAGSTLPAGLTISPAGLISGTPATAGTFAFNLTATDSFGCVTTTGFTLVVTPTLTMPTAVLPTGTVGISYPVTQLPSPTGGTTPYNYVAVNLPAGLSLDPLSGQITGTPTQSGNFTFPVTITDADGNTVSTNFTILVRDPLLLPAATLSDGTTGVPYPAQIIPSATGGSGVYTYSATNVPAGLTFNPITREITGTPTQSGTFTFPITVTDNEGRTITSNYTIVVKDPLLLATATLPDGNVSVLYPGATIPAATGGTGPGTYTYAATNLPPGLLFTPGTRTITGTPTQSGTYTVLVTVTDQTPTSVTVPYTIRVIGQLNLPAATLADGTVGVTYNSAALPAATGGTGTVTYAIPNLPAGLTFDPNTRVISGTPTAGGMYTVKMTAADGGGLTTSTDYLLNINVAAPIVASSTICSGNSTTLIASNPTTGVSYNFYSATGNTPLATGPTYNTGILTQTTTYYVEAISGTAVSARVPVTITVNPAPAAPTVITNGVTISNNQSATLQATAEAGSTIQWYALATGGTPVATGGTFTTPLLTANTTYYVGADNSNGCSSLTRVPVEITVLGPGSAPGCNTAATQQSGITGLLCVACSIQNPGNSTDADVTNYTRLSLVVGVAAAGYQRLIFQNAGSATDSIRLDLGTATGLLDLTALGGITINVMSGNTVVRSYPLNNSLVNLNLLNGTRFSATVLAGGAYDRVEVRFSPTVAALTSVDIYGAQVILPNPTLVAGNQTICSGATASLNATAAAGTTLTWYSAATGGSVLANGATYTTPALTATTTYYIEVSRANCANPTRVPVTVTVIPAVATPTLATVAPVCAGSPAVLAVNNPQPGITYRWYTDAVGGTPVLTDTVFVTPALTANATYYLEASNGNCTAAARVAANITVNPRPILPQLQASATTVTQGQTVSLTATSSQSDVVFNWYNAANATTPVFTGPNYVTPPLTATTTFYVDATSTVTGCASSARVQQTIIVNGSGTPVPVPCENPISQTNGRSGTLSVLARVDNPTLAIDGDQQTASTLSIPVGINAAVFQKVDFAGLSNIGDTVRVRLTATNQLLSLSVLSNVTVTTYQGANSNNDGLALNNGLINIQLLNGGTEALVNFVPTAQFDGVEVRLNSGVLGALAAIDFNYARRIIQAPIVTANAVAVCSNATATLSVSNPQTGVIYKWYDNNGTYLGNDGITFTTAVITADTRFFVEASRGGCGGSRDTVNVTVIPAPGLPVLLSATESTCQNSNLLLQVQNPEAGVTYQWYLGGVAITGATASTYAINNIQASGVYSVAAINSCNVASAQATVTITVGSLTAPVLNPLALTVNSGEQTILTASSSTQGLTYIWYNNAALTNVVSSSTNGADGTFITPALTATTTYYVTAQNTVGACVSPAGSIVVTVNPMPTNPGSVPCEPAVSQTIRSGGTLSAFTSVNNAALAVDDDIETSSSLFIPFGVNSFVAQKVNFSGLSQVGDTVRLRLSSPNGGLTLSVGSSITVTTYNGLTSNNDERTISSTGLNLQLNPNGQSAIIDFVPGAAFDGVELKLNSGLLGAPTAVNFNYARRIILAPSPTAASLTVCEGSSATLGVNNPASGISYKWYKDATQVATTATYQIPADLAVGVHNYFVSATRNGCESTKVPVTVTVVALPSSPVASAGNPVTTCINTPVTLSVDPIPGVTFNWYDAATGGNLLAANSISYTTSGNLTAGTTDFYVEAVNGNSCASTAARTKVSITINPDATATDLSVAGAEVPFCIGTNASLTATSTTVINPVFTWYTDAALTNAVYTGETYNIASLSASTNYYVTVRGDNKCENAAGMALMVRVTVNPTATAADINITGIPTNLCSGSAVTLTASSTTVTNPVFTWYSDAALTNALFTGPMYTTPVLTGNTNFYVTVQGSDRCPNTAANAKVVMLTVNPTATAADVSVNGVPSSVCAGTGVTLTATSLTVVNPVFTWYTDVALSNAVFTGSVFNTPAINSNTTYYVTVRGDNKCENIAGDAAVVVLNSNPPIIFNGGALPDGMTVSTYTTQLNSATGGTPGYVYLVASGNSLPPGLVLSPTGVLTGIPLIAGNYTFAVTVIDGRGCNATATFTLSITSTGALILPPATLPEGLVGTPYPPQTLPAPIGGTAPYTYVAIGVPPGLTFDPATRTISGTPTLGGTFTITVTVTDANGLTAAANYILIVRVPAPVVAPAESCGGNSVTLAVTTPVAGVTYNWYASASGGNILGTGTTFQTPAITATTTYYAEGVSGTAMSSRTPVVVTLKQDATAADVTVSGVPTTICAGSGAVLTASSTTVTNPVFTWYTDVALSNAVFTGATYSIPSLTDNTNYFVTVSGDNKCENESGTGLLVALNVNPSLTFNGTTLSSANAGTAYSVQISPANGGTPAYTYAVATGSSLPAGLSLSSTGVISGTPATAGSYNFTLIAIDSKGCTATANFFLTVSGNSDGPIVDNATACNGSPVTLTVRNPVNGVTYNWYNTASGGNVIYTGTSFQTPPVTANTNYYVEGVSGATITARTSVSITLKPNANSSDVVVSGIPTTVCSGSSVSLTASSTTVTNPVFTWYTDAALTNAVFTGTTYTVPALSSSTTLYVTVRGDNICENTASTARIVVLTVNPAIVYTGSSLTPASQSSAYNVALNTATGGTPAYTYSLASGSGLPAGLTLSAAGILSGTPTANGNYSFGVTVTDSRGCNATATFSLNVGMAITMSLPPAVLPNGEVGTPYTPTTLPAAIGGTGPFTYVATGLPPGITFNPITRELTGIPTLGGTFTITVSVTDANGLTAAADYTVIVTVPAPGVGNTESCDGISTLLTVSNPVARVTYRWYTSASGGTSIFTGTSYQTPTVTSTTAYYVEGSSGTAVSSRVAANVVLLPKLSTPEVSVLSSTLNSITFSWNDVTGAVNYEISVDGGATWQNPSSGASATIHTVTGLNAQGTITLMVRAKGTSACQTSAPGSFKGTANGGGGGNNDEVFIPNTFTPNGDGKNDIFYVYGSTIAKIQMRVYNQWGQFIYQSLQVQNGWDGTYKGQLQPNGVYVYYIDITLADGTKTMRKGTITLLR